MEIKNDPDISTPKGSTPEYFEIKQDINNYKLKIKIINQDIILNILDEKSLMREYEIKLTLNELKQIHNIFLGLSSFKEFIDFIKVLIENKKLSIKKSDQDKMTIELSVEYLYKQHLIKIDLLKKAINFELISLDLYKKISILNKNFKNLEINYKSIKEENNGLKEENKRIKKENVNIKEKIKNLEDIILSLKKEITKIKNNTEKKSLPVSINSSIMEKNEFDMIHSEIKLRMNKEIKEIEKLYQATKDGDEPHIFHEKCDNIANTLVLYKSAGNRRFGGFASECWTSKEETKLDKNAFLFSLDQKKIYPPKNNNYYEIICDENEGPGFSRSMFYCIQIKENPLQKKSLFTYEAEHKEIFNGEKNALSEDGNFKGIYTKEYEVFKLYFDINL